VSERPCGSRCLFLSGSLSRRSRSMRRSSGWWLNPDHTIQVPTNFADAGWFRPGPEPGEVGAPLVVGQLASIRWPGVFCRARIELRLTLVASRS
jgi:hypothetical protein